MAGEPPTIVLPLTSLVTIAPAANIFQVNDKFYKGHIAPPCKRLLMKKAFHFFSLLFSRNYSNIVVSRIDFIECDFFWAAIKETSI